MRLVGIAALVFALALTFVVLAVTDSVLNGVTPPTAPLKPPACCRARWKVASEGCTWRRARCSPTWLPPAQMQAKHQT